MRLSRLAALAAIALAVGASSSFAGTLATSKTTAVGVPGLTAPTGATTIGQQPSKPPNYLPCRNIFYPEDGGFYHNTCTNVNTYLH
jgi:hypothetical protein